MSQSFHAGLAAVTRKLTLHFNRPDSFCCPFQRDCGEVNLSLARTVSSLRQSPTKKPRNSNFGAPWLPQPLDCKRKEKRNYLCTLECSVWGGPALMCPPRGVGDIVVSSCPLVTAELLLEASPCERAG